MVWYLQNISSSALHAKWNPLNESYWQGPLLGYVVYFRETDVHEVCTFYKNCTHWNSTRVNTTVTELNIYGLGFYTNYTVWVAAFTDAGEGPKSNNTGTTHLSSKCLNYKVVGFFGL